MPAGRQVREAVHGRSVCVPPLLLAIALGLGGCSRNAETLRVIQGSAPTTLDPHHHNEITAWSVLCNVCDGLVAFSREMRLEPALAESWQQLDATHVRFHLRSGVRFANGDPFTAADVVASFLRARDDPLSRVRHYLVDITAMKAEDDHTLLVTTAGPSATLLNRLVFLFIVPQSQAREAEITTPVGTGPYRWVERRRDGSVVLEGWNSWRGRPRISRVVVSFEGDDEKRTSSFLAGGIDICLPVADDMVGEVQARPTLSVLQQPRMVVQIITVVPSAAKGAASRALADVRVRRAILLALDRRDLVERAFHGTGTVASQYVHPVVFGFDPTLSPLPYDPDEARRLLAAAGFANGFDVELAYGVASAAPPQAIADQLGRVGIRVKLLALPFPELMLGLRAGTLPLAYFARTSTTGEASEYLDAAFHSRDAARGLGDENFSGYADRETDALLDAAERELDPAARLVDLQRAQRRVLEQLPTLPLAVRWCYTGVSPRVDVVLRHDQWLWFYAFRWRR